MPVLNMKIKEIYSKVDIEWCRSMMEKHDLSNKDVYGRLQITKGALSKKLNPDSDRPLKSNESKIAIYTAIKELIDIKTLSKEIIAFSKNNNLSFKDSIAFFKSKFEIEKNDRMLWVLSEIEEKKC